MLRGNPDVAELIEVPAGSGWWASRRLIAPSLAPLRPGADRAVLGPRPPVRLRGGEARARGQVTDEPKSWWKRALLEHRVRMNDDQSHSVVAEAAPARALGRTARRAPGRAGGDAAAGRDRVRAQAAVRGAAGAGGGRLQALAAGALARRSSRALLERGLQVVLTGAPSAGRSRRWSNRCATARRATMSSMRAGRLDLNQVGALLARRCALRRRRHRRSRTSPRPARSRSSRSYGPIDPRYFGPWPPNPTLAVPVSPRTPWCSAPGTVSGAAGTPALRALQPGRLRGPQRQRERLPADAWRPGASIAEVDRILGRAR